MTKEQDFTKVVKIGNETITSIPTEIVQHLNPNKSEILYLFWAAYGSGASIISFTIEDMIKIDNKFNKQKKEERKLINKIEEEVKETRLNTNNDNNYNDEWTKELREAVRKRDNYECQRCHREQESEVALDVHHINSDKENPVAELITLCPYCHKVVTFGDKQKYRLELLKILEQRNIVNWTRKYLAED